MLGAHPEHMRAWRLFVFLRCLIYKVQPLNQFSLFQVLDLNPKACSRVSEEL